MKTGRAGEAAGGPSHSWHGKTSAGLLVRQPSCGQGNGTALRRGLPQEQEVSHGHGKATATPARVGGQRPGIAGPQLPSKASTCFTQEEFVMTHSPDLCTSGIKVFQFLVLLFLRYSQIIFLVSSSFLQMWMLLHEAHFKTLQW